MSVPEVVAPEPGAMCFECGRVNRHGVPQDSEPRHKVAHCVKDCWPRGYYIVYEEGDE